MPGEASVALRPEFDRHRLADAETFEAVFRQADQHLAFAVGGQAEDRLSGRHHLAHLDAPAGDHAILGRAQHGVAGLVVGDVEFGADLLQPRLAGAVAVLDVLELGMADQVAVEQGAVAPVLGAHGLQVGLGGTDLGPRRLQLQAHVLGIEFGQGLVLLYPLADFHQPADDLAADAEGQLRLVAGADLAGKGLAHLPAGWGLTTIAGRAAAGGGVPLPQAARNREENRDRATSGIWRYM